MQKTTKEMVAELRTAVLGVPDTDERGIAGDVKDIKSHMGTINGTVAENAKGVAATKTSTRNLWLAVSGIFVLLAGISVALIQVASHTGG